MPTWFGDCLMATPTLRALREAFPDAELTAAIEPPLTPLLEGLGPAEGVDRILPIHKARAPRALRAAAETLRRENFEAAVLLPNSFRSALLARLAEIPRRIGYDRDRRGLLLTERLVPRRGVRRRGDGGGVARSAGFLPVPTVDYYLSLARFCGAGPVDPTLRVAVTASDRDNARRVLGEASDGGPDPRPLVLLNPGSAKPRKRWSAARFGRLADLLIERHGVRVALLGSPAEEPVRRRVQAAASQELADLPAAGLTLGGLKAVVERASLLVTNDTGPRHLAAALGTPCTVLYGTTSPHWTDLGCPTERAVVADPVAEGEPPMSGLHLETVAAAATQVLDRQAAGASTAASA